MLTDDVLTIKNSTFDEIKKSEKVLLLLKTYSKLFLNGGQPKLCEACQHGYYKQIYKDGMKQAQLIDEVNRRTLELNWEGLRYYQRSGNHINSIYLTDSKAIELLNDKIMLESEFAKLPDGYKQPVKEEPVKDEQKENHIPEVSKLVEEKQKPKQFSKKHKK